jgi:quercetin dioxygenase-like cupin family protein
LAVTRSPCALRRAAAVPDGSQPPLVLVAADSSLMTLFSAVKPPSPWQLLVRTLVVMPRAADPTPEQPISRAVLMDARLPQVKETSRIEVREIKILPGYAAGLHVHNGPVVGSIVAGSAIYQIEGQPETVLRAGDVFYEPEGERIARFDAGDDGVTFLAYFPLAPGQEAQLTFPATSSRAEGAG